MSFHSTDKSPSGRVGGSRGVDSKYGLQNLGIWDEEYICSKFRSEDFYVSNFVQKFKLYRNPFTMLKCSEACDCLLAAIGARRDICDKQRLSKSISTQVNFYFGTVHVCIILVLVIFGHVNRL